MTFDLAGDEASVERQRHNSQLKWDKKKKKFIKGDGAGADNSDNDNNDDGAQSQQSLEKSNLLAVKLYQSICNANKSAAFLEQMLKSGNIK